MDKEFHPEDYEELKYMSTEDIISTLEYIRCGYLPQEYGNENGTETDYENTKLQLAVKQAIDKLKEME